MMQIIDLHCDALLKLYESQGTYSFYDEPELDVNYKKMVEGKVKVQAFAIFVPSNIKLESKFQVVFDQIYYFYDEILRKYPRIKLIKEWCDIGALKEGEIGALLTLEGVDAIGNDFKKIRILYELGVRSIGLTWNDANLAADGIGEARGGGLTTFGREIVQFANERKLLTDVSHLSEQAFWDVLTEAHYPIASHSNAKRICPHRRNLSDDQARAMFNKKAMIHVVYYPDFVKDNQEVNIQDLIAHIDHFCSLGGVNHIGLGSDFDGIDKKIPQLEDASQHPRLIEALLTYYTEEEVRGFAYQNFLKHLPK